MIILLLFAFVSGLVTILAPCIWPLLPVILSATATGGKMKPLGITIGITLSFALFTLTLSYIVKLIPFNPDVLRIFAVIVISFLGLTLIIPQLSQVLEGYVSRITGSFAGREGVRSGFLGGFVTGFSLGIVWSPCAGPILATIATLAATQSVNTAVIAVTIAYVAGVGVPLFLFATVGTSFFTRNRSISRYTGKIQQVFGLVMILTALAIITNYDKTIQARLLDAFPSYSQFLFKLEGNESVKKQLDTLKEKKDMKNKEKEVNKLMPNIIIPQSGLPVLGTAPEFVGISRWLNSEPLTMAQLKGKVVLVDFWTYTCINCIRTLPHVTGWYEKYKGKGFVVVGVHTPEFEFEKNTTNVANAIRQFGITYPVAQDNEYATWRAYDNHYWPAKYLVDAQGKVRWIHFGEGKYDEAEQAIQALLTEAGTEATGEMSQIKDQTPRVRLTPETYLGSLRMERFSSNEPRTEGLKDYTLPRYLTINYFAYGGKWDIQSDHSVTGKDAVLRFRYFANKVFLVMTPKSKNGRVKVLLDGKGVEEEHQGKDVKNAYIIFDEPRLYELIDDQGAITDHELRLEFESEGTKIYAFTFGQ